MWYIHVKDNNWKTRIFSLRVQHNHITIIYNHKHASTTINNKTNATNEVKFYNYSFKHQVRSLSLNTRFNSEKFYKHIWLYPDSFYNCDGGNWRPERKSIFHLPSFFSFLTYDWKAVKIYCGERLRIKSHLNTAIDAPPIHITLVNCINYIYRSACLP